MILSLLRGRRRTGRGDGEWRLAWWLAVLVFCPRIAAADDVLVAQLDVQDEVAHHIEAVLADACSEVWDVSRMEDVPAFTAYSARVYLASCEPDAYDGCLEVLGGRIGTRWVLGGRRVVRGDDDRVELVLRDLYAPPGASPLRLVVPATFSAELRETVRRWVTSADAAERSHDDTRILASEPSEYRGVNGEYPLLDLDRELQRGPRGWTETSDGRRAGDLRLRVGGLVVGGSQVQSHEVWYTVDNADLETVVGQRAVQSQRLGPSVGGEVGLEVGLTRHVDVDAYVAWRGSSYRYRFVESIPGLDQAVPAPSDRWVGSPQIGARLGLVPWPKLDVRPTLDAGGSVWFGRAIGDVARIPREELVSGRMVANRLWLVDVHPGVERDVGSAWTWWVRADIEIPVGGRYLQVIRAGDDAALAGGPEEATAMRAGFGGSTGLTFRMWQLRRRG